MSARSMAREYVEARMGELEGAASELINAAAAAQPDDVRAFFRAHLNASADDEPSNGAGAPRAAPSDKSEEMGELISEVEKLRAALAEKDAALAQFELRKQRVRAA